MKNRAVIFLALSVALTGCDFQNPLSMEKLPLDAKLIGTWKSGDVTIAIVEGAERDTYKVHYAKVTTAGDVTSEETMDFVGWATAHNRRTYLNLKHTEDPGTFIVGQYIVRDNEMAFGRVNRDFPGEYNPEQQGDFGLAKLSSAQLAKHIDTNIRKPNFFASKVLYTRAE